MCLLGSHRMETVVFSAMEFARNVLGGTYVVVFLSAIVLVALVVGPVVERNKPIGIALLLIGVVPAMALAAEVKHRVRKRAERRKGRSSK